MSPTYQDITVTVDASGDATKYSGDVSGRILCIQYVKNDYSNGSTFLITTETTLQTVWSESNVNASAVRCPRQATHLNTTGAAALYAAAGTGVLDYIWTAGERIKIVVSGGGNAKTATFRIWTDE